MGTYKYASQLKKEEFGIPKRLKGLYNEICNNNIEKIEKDLVDNEFAPYFIEVNELKAPKTI